MAALAGFAPAKKPLAGFADAKKPLAGFADAKPSQKGVADAKTLAGFADATKAPALSGFAAAKKGAATTTPTGARSSGAVSRSIPPGRVGGVVPRGAPLAKDVGAGGGARRTVFGATPPARNSGACDACGWVQCQCAHAKVARIVGPPLPEGAVCRVCFDGDDDEPLVSPCACRGDSRFAHLSCLKRWAESASKSGGAQSYKCPTCVTRYHGPTAVALAVQRVDLELDRPEARLPGGDGDMTNVEAAVYNMRVVCAYEGVDADGPLLRRHLRKHDGRGARVDEVLEVLKGLGLEEKMHFNDLDVEKYVASLRGDLERLTDPKTSADRLARASKMHVLAMVLAEKCVQKRHADGSDVSFKDEKQLLADAKESKALALEAHDACKTILGPSHPDTRKYFRYFGQVSMVHRLLNDEAATRARREKVADRLRGA